MKALVTGIAGFAGNYLSKLLLEEGLDVYGVSQEEEFRPFLPFDRAAIRYVSLNIQDQARIGDLLSDIRPDLIFHLAAKSSPSESAKFPRETFEVNLGGTLTMLEAIRLRQLRCRFLLVSSSHVYGSAPAVSPVPEDTALKPESPYAASKAAAELATYQYWKTYGTETITVRAFNHTGPGQGEGFVCPDLSRKVVEIERGLRPPRLAVSNLTRRVDFSDVRDVVQGYYSALVNGGPGETYNLCSGKGITIQTLIENLAAWSGKAIDAVPCPAERSAGGKRGVIGDNSRAIRKLKWNPAIPFLSTLREVLEYCRQSYPATPLPSEHGGLPRTGHLCS